MTIDALRRLLEEEQPHVPRHPAPHPPRQHWTAKETPDMDHRPKPTTPPAEEALSVNQLLDWADTHTDPDVQDQSARARAALTGLRTRHAADTELARITEEAEQLEQRLAALRARETELRPTGRKKTRKAERDHDPAVVRAWAKQQGIECAPLGRVPRAVVDQWRAAGQPQPLHIAS